MALAGEPTERTIGCALVVHLAHGIVEANGVEQTNYDHNDELLSGIAAKEVAKEPTKHVERIEGNERNGSANMREAQLNEQVVKVASVGMERRYAAEDATKHNAQGVEDGHGEHAQRECHNAKARVVQGRQRRVVDHSHAEDAHQHAQHQCARVANKHLALQSEHIVEEEWHQRSSRQRGHDGHRTIIR